MDVFWGNSHSLGADKVAQEQELAHQLLRALLVATGSSESDNAWAVSERLVDSSSDWRGLGNILDWQMSKRRHVGGGLEESSGRDLSTGHHSGGRFTLGLSDDDSGRRYGGG